MNDLDIIPKPHVANKSSVADFVEIECLRRADHNISALDLTRMISRETDILSDEAIQQYVDEVFDELATRVSHAGPGCSLYPYRVDQTGRLLYLRQDMVRSQIQIYLYLLLATRMDMSKDRDQGGEDATRLFEEICSAVSIRLWGGPDERVSSLVFGTARLSGKRRPKNRKKQSRQEDCEAPLVKKGFQSAIEHLCASLGEGSGFSNTGLDRITAQDGKLDIVVWRRFSDNRPGQVIGFGQCKTGTHWKADLTGLQPDGFCSKWMRARPAVLPIRLYFVTDRVLDRWYDTCVDGGVLIDRCRIIEYADGLPVQLLRRIGKWVNAAAKIHKLRLV